MPKIFKAEIAGNVRLFIQVVVFAAGIFGAYYGITGRLDVLDERMKPIAKALDSHDRRVTFLERLHFKQAQ